ncbi:CTP synthase [Striga asiatica]|uniref:CTP synthase n=1 Tax=Striga asiatica TaxID=4170 RepID=A0A5A7Q2L6_STRAF|nr:CTP synthase [Striga asiatica]
MGGDLLVKKQSRQEAIRKWRLKKLKRNFTVNHTTYVDIIPNISAPTLDTFSKERRQKAIERWKAKKDRSQSLQPSVTLLSDVNVVRQHCTIEPIHAVQRTGLYDSQAESNNATNLRKREPTYIYSSSACSSTECPKLSTLSCKKFEYETYNLCCLDGDECLATNDAPLIFQELYTSSSLEANLFRTCIRTINNHFTFTSMEVHYDKALSKRNNGIYTFKVQGQIYHFIDDFFESVNLQLYFHDTDTEVTKRLEACPRLT